MSIISEIPVKIRGVSFSCCTGQNLFNNTVMNTLEILLPVIIIISLGFVLRKTEFLTAEFTSGLGKLAYWVGLPAFLFYETSSMRGGFEPAFVSFGIMMCGMAAAIAAAVAICLIFRVRGDYAGVFIQGAFRGNLAYIGIPVVFYTFAEHSSRVSDEMSRMSILTLAMCVPAYNIVAVIVLLVTGNAGSGRQFLKVIGRIVTNPLIIAVAAGLLFAKSGLDMPMYAERSFKAIAGLVLPAALLCVGATVAQTQFSWPLLRYSLSSSLIKIGLCPLAGYYAAKMFSLSSDATLGVMIMLAAPTAVSSFILAEQLNGDKELSASIIVNSTILSLGAYAVILTLLA